MGQPKKPDADGPEEHLDVDADPASVPSLAFLDYLGTLIKDGDTWVGPDDMPMPADDAAPRREGDAQ